MKLGWPIAASAFIAAAVSGDGGQTDACRMTSAIASERTRAAIRSIAPGSVSFAVALANVPTVVMPPASAAIEPLVKSSANDGCKCVWGSMPPGSTRRPAASIIRVLADGRRLGPTSVIVSPTILTSASRSPSALTTRPRRISNSGG